MTDRLQKILLELKGRLSEIYGERLEHLILFGSHARNDADMESDIDVLVVLKGEVDDSKEIIATSTIMSELSLKYDKVMSGVWVSSTEYELRRGPLLHAVHREGISF